MEYSSFAKCSPCYIYPQHWLASHRIVTNALHLFPQTRKEFYLLCQIEQNIKGHITMIWTIEGWSSASKLSFLKMWFYIFHSFIYFYIFYIHAEIYILIQTESMEVFRNPFLERRFALRYTFIWDLLYSIHSFEIWSTVYFHIKSCPSHHHQSRFYLQRCIAWKEEKKNVKILRQNFSSPDQRCHSVFSQYSLSSLRERLPCLHKSVSVKFQYSLSRWSSFPGQIIHKIMFLTIYIWGSIFAICILFGKIFVEKKMYDFLTFVFCPAFYLCQFVK